MTRTSYRLLNYCFPVVFETHSPLVSFIYHGTQISRWLTPSLAQPLPYFPEELNHFQEFTHFLDSIGLPSEWVPALREVPQVQGTVPADVPDPVRDPREPQQGASRRSQAERSRADSPFRSWLPSVPSGDQSLGTVSDYGEQ